jgi:quercetin dioxygenase-like cupin family protein
VENATLTPFERHASLENSVWQMGNLFSFLANAQDTHNQFAVMEIKARRGFEPPPHTHSRDDEAFYLLEGEIEFYIGNHHIHAKAGSFVFAPRGIMHSFQFTTDEVRMLVISTPPGLEAGFQRLSEPAQTLDLPPIPTTPPDVPRLIQVFGELGVTFAPPPADR